MTDQKQKQKDLEELLIYKFADEYKEVLGCINFNEIGKIFDYRGDEVEFFKAQILVEGLTQFHITTKPNITDEQKRECVRETIRLWNDKGTPITNL